MRRSPEYLFKPRLGLVRGSYAERPLVERGGTHSSLSMWVQRARGASWGRSRTHLTQRLEVETEFFKGRDSSWLNAYAESMRGQLARQSSPGVSLMARALALVAEGVERTTDRRPSMEELEVASAVLEGRIVVHGVDCDRGTSLVLAGAVAALGGVPVHIVSARESRAVELAGRFEPLIKGLGMRSSALLQKDSIEGRRRAWRSDVMFVGVAALMNAFLEDRRAAQGAGGRASRLVARLASGPGAVAEMRLRGLYLALLDDAGGLLCDFATRPFIVGDQKGTDEERSALLEGEGGLPPSQRSKIGVRSTLGCVMRRYLALGGATPSAAGLAGEICREFEHPVVTIGGSESTAVESFQLHKTREERDTWLREEFATLSSAGEGAWVLCASPESVNALRELGVQAGVEFTEWERGMADPRNFHVLCGQIGQDLPIGPEGTVVGPPLVLIADCLDALHLERQILDRLQPTHVRRCVSLEDECASRLLTGRSLSGLRRVAALAPIVHRWLARRLVKTVHSRGESARRRARRAYATAEEEEHRLLAFAGPPSA